MATSVINQITERLTKGVANGTDELTFSALSVVRVGISPSSSDYLAPQDYKLTAGAIDWSPTGKEPTTGQQYFVTYTFQPPSSILSFQDVSDQMDVNMRALQPLATTQPGSVSRNLFIDLPSTQLATLYSAIERVAHIQSLLNLEDFEGTELDDFAANFQVFRGGATFSTGSATFSAPTLATSPILVPVGTRVSTLSTTTQSAAYFVTTEDGTIYPGQSSVTVPIQAEVIGSSGNVGSGTIVTLAAPIIGITGVTNPDPTTGGTDQESDADFATRLQNSFLSNDAMTFRGIRRLALEQENVIDALVVGAGDPLLEREGGTGGKVDLYIQAEANLGRSQEDSKTYSGSNVVLDHQPVLSISSVFNVTTALTVPPASYVLVRDVGLLSDSVRAEDAIQFTGGVSPGDVLSISYVSNGVLEDVQAFFDQDSQAVPARDFLTRAATQVPIDVTVTLSLVAGYAFSSVEPRVVDAVATHIDSLELGASIRYKDIYDIVATVEGVDDVQPFNLLAKRGEASAAAIELARNEYPLAGNIVVNEAA